MGYNGQYFLEMVGTCAPVLLPSIDEVERMSEIERFALKVSASQYSGSGNVSFDLLGLLRGRLGGSTDGSHRSIHEDQERYLSLVRSRYFTVSDAARAMFNDCALREMQQRANYVGTVLQVVRSDAHRVRVRLEYKSDRKQSGDLIVSLQGVRASADCALPPKVVSLTDGAGVDMTFCRSSVDTDVHIDVERTDGDNRFVSRLTVPAPIARVSFQVTPRVIGGNAGDLGRTTGSNVCGWFVHYSNIPKDLVLRAFIETEGRLPTLYVARVSDARSSHPEISFDRIHYDAQMALAQTLSNSGAYFVVGGISPARFLEFDRAPDRDCREMTFYPENIFVTVRSPAVSR